MRFDNNDDLKHFSKVLSEKLLLIGELSLTRELKRWDEGCFTTSSEFLGEFKLILKRVKQVDALDIATNRDVERCITTINKAFGIFN